MYDSNAEGISWNLILAEILLIIFFREVLAKW